MQKETATQELEKVLKKWTSTDYGRRHFIKAVPLLMASCATVEQTRYREGSNKGQNINISVGDEKKMAAQVLPKLKKQYPPVQNSYLQSYIKDVGRRITSANGLEANPYNYSFEMVNAPMINAFALPAGPVFVTIPLLAATDSEAELAGVVGHEIGHVKARHAAERIDQQQRKQSSGGGKSLLWTIGAGVLGGAVGFGLGKMLCRGSSNKRSCEQKAMQYGAMAGGMGGLLIQKYAFMANSREDEMEADRVGYLTSTKAGYHKDHVGKFYEKLYAMEQKRGGGSGGINKIFADALSTHPPSTQRIQQMNQMAKSMAPQSGATINSGSYIKARNLARSIASRYKKA